MPKRCVNPALFGSLCLVLLISLTWQLSVPAHAQAQPKNPAATKNILILHALEAICPSTSGPTGNRGGPGSGRNWHEESVFRIPDLQRNPDVKHRQALTEMMRLRFGKRKIDLVITLYPEALEFLLKDCREIFPDVPIVALYMAPNFELPKTGHRIIQHVFRTDMQGTLEIALKLVPGQCASMLWWSAFIG